MPGGGVLLDTPGLRELQLWSGEEVIGGVFEEIAHLAEQCRFADCAHETEPGCAVNAALAHGKLDAERLTSFRKLRAEAMYLDTRTDQLARGERKRSARIAARALEVHVKLKYE